MNVDASDQGCVGSGHMRIQQSKSRLVKFYARIVMHWLFVCDQNMNIAKP